MSSLPSLLLSVSPAVRTRGISLLSSLLMTKPADVLYNFEHYYPFFHEMLENRNADSITYFTLNDLLCSTISRLPKGQVPPNAVVALLKYISECLTYPATGGHVNAFVSDIFSVSSFTDSAHYLSIASKQQVFDFIPYLVKILSVTNNSKILSNLLPIGGNIVNYVISNPSKNLIDDVFKCSLSDVPEISNFAAAILNQASAGKQIEIMKLLVPYTAPIQNHVNYQTCQDLKQLHQRLSEVLLQETYKASPDHAPFEPLARAMFAQKTFDVVDTTNIKKFLNDKPQSHNSTSTTVKSTSLAHHLDIISKVTIMEPPAPKPVKTAAEKAQPQLKFLKTFAQKKGGGLGTQWQKRYFEFYPSNKCLVWRQTDTMDGVKGVLFLDHNVKVEKNNLNLTLKIKEKTHSIMFDQAAVLEEWYTTLTTCTGQ